MLDGPGRPGRDGNCQHIRGRRRLESLETHSVPEILRRASVPTLPCRMKTEAGDCRGCPCPVGVRNPPTRPPQRTINTQQAEPGHQGLLREDQGRTDAVEQEFAEACRARPASTKKDGDEDALVQIVDPAEETAAESQDRQRIHRAGPPRVLNRSDTMCRRCTFVLAGLAVMALASTSIAAEGWSLSKLVPFQKSSASKRDQRLCVRCGSQARDLPQMSLPTWGRNLTTPPSSIPPNRPRGARSRRTRRTFSGQDEGRVDAGHVSPAKKSKTQSPKKSVRRRWFSSWIPHAK